jgi:hypothetical protein
MVSVIALVIMLVGGLCAGGIAGAKNRSSFGWFVFGFITPLIAVIAASCVAPLPAPEEA